MAIKAKFAAQCPVCDKFWEVGDLIEKLDVPVVIHGWYDYGKNKGKGWTKLRTWADVKCARIKNEQSRTDKSKQNQSS
jgi:hypothetical protein